MNCIFMFLHRSWLLHNDWIVISSALTFHVQLLTCYQCKQWMSNLQALVHSVFCVKVKIILHPHRTCLIKPFRLNPKGKQHQYTDKFYINPHDLIIQLHAYFLIHAFLELVFLLCGLVQVIPCFNINTASQTNVASLWPILF